jgi:hypothetical protein
MAQWGSTDQASDSPRYANTTLNSTKNQTELFLNTTEDDVITDLKVGVFGISADEMAYANTADTEVDAVTHAGWVLRKEGTGGRAGRVQYETLVAGGSITGDAADDAVAPEEN